MKHWIKIASAGLGTSLALLLSGCATGTLGTFSDTTYVDREKYHNFRELGPVQGESCQTMVLYVFPYAEPPGTHEAIKDALSQIEGTVFLTDVAVEYRQNWRIGYSELCTRITATAYGADLNEEADQAE